MTDFTPGPWAWVESDENGYSSLCNPKTGEEVLTVGGVNDGDSPIVWMGEDLTSVNRRLIAVSPTLYGALKRLVEAQEGTWLEMEAAIIGAEAILALVDRGLSE